MTQIDVLYRSIVIVGGKGMLARAIRKLLDERQLKCVAVDIDTHDLTKEADVQRLFEEQRPSLLINCAAYTAVDKCETNRELADAVNGYAVERLARWAKQLETTLVHFSTDYVFDGSVARPLRPDDPVGPRSAYGQSKLLGERLLQENAPGRWLILRTAWLYGLGGPNFPQTMVNAARAGKPLKVVTDQFGSPTYTADLATATLDLLDRGASGIVHVANAGQTNWRDFAVATLHEFGIDAPVGGLTSADWKAIRPDSAERPAYSVFDLSPLERLLGRPMPTWQDALHRFRLAVDANGGF